MKFTTDWKKIGQSGPTMDGREIDAAWLTEAAETYDPATYTAVIWIDHFRFYGSQGKVVELKAVEEDGVVSLYARLQPNEHLLSWNKEKQKQFTSMELTPDFAKSGKCYLSGLAVTDMPASLGTTELRFSHRKQKPEDLFLPGVELGNLEEGGLKDSLMPQWFSNWLGNKGKDIPHNQGTTPESEEDTMTAEQFEQLQKSMAEAITLGFTSLGDSLDKKFSAPPAPVEEVDEGKAPESGDFDFTAEIAKAMEPFSAKLDALTVRFEKVNPGTPAPATTSPATTGADYL